MFWVLLAGAVVIWCVVIGAAIYAQRVQPRPEREKQARAFIVWGGAVFPTFVVGGLLVWGLMILDDITHNEAPLTIHVDGEQWWWRVTYETPEGDVVSANEIRLPVGERTLFRLTSDDVIHSFWVPALGGKMDMIPGRETGIVLTPEETGNWGGLCAEFCGGAHAQMRFDAVVMEQGAFDQWLAAEAEPAGTAGPGLAAFLREGCGACHTIRGTEARGEVGPDLTHFGSRARLGAGLYANTPQNLRRWITHTPEMKPGVKMPAFPLIDEDRLVLLVDYLMGLE